MADDQGGNACIPKVELLGLVNSELTSYGSGYEIDCWIEYD
jgi:hypothetical protein